MRVELILLLGKILLGLGLKQSLIHIFIHFNIC